MKYQYGLFSDIKADGNSLLMDAAIEGNDKKVDALISVGADINYIDEYGDTPLAQAAFKGHTQIVKRMLDLDAKAYSKNRALLLSAQKGHEKIMDLLIEKKADVNIYMEGYNTPLFQTIGQNRMGAFKRLLSAPGINLDQEVNEGIIPLLMAAYNGRLEMVKLLIENGARSDIKNKNVQTAIDLARLGKREEVEKYLSGIKPVPSFPRGGI